MTQYRAVVGIDYPPNKRVEAGELVSDLPEKSAIWLLSAGLIEEPNGKSSKKIKEETPVVEVVKLKVVPFKPEAKDGDGDGFVQDGTIHQRPVESENK